MTTTMDQPISKSQIERIVKVMEMMDYYFTLPGKNFRDFEGQKLIRESVEERRSGEASFNDIVYYFNKTKTMRVRDAEISQRSIIGQYVICIPLGED
jgi:hypothetical protein